MQICIYLNYKKKSTKKFYGKPCLRMLTKKKTFIEPLLFYSKENTKIFKCLCVGQIKKKLLDKSRMITWTLTLRLIFKVI